MGRRAAPRVTRPPDLEAGGISDRPLVIPARPPSTLDVVIHERMRLAMVSALALNSYLTFTELKRMLNMTDGNLSVHARRLEEVGYIESSKVGARTAARTEYRLTAAGRRALDRYLQDMEALIGSLKA